MCNREYFHGSWSRFPGGKSVLWLSSHQRTDILTLQDNCSVWFPQSPLQNLRRTGQWVKTGYPKWNPGKWKHGPKSAVPCCHLTHTHLGGRGDSRGLKHFPMFWGNSPSLSPSLPTSRLACPSRHRAWTISFLCLHSWNDLLDINYM